jgi:hypothetical protein
MFGPVRAVGAARRYSVSAAPILGRSLGLLGQLSYIVQSRLILVKVVRVVPAAPSFGATKFG